MGKPGLALGERVAGEREGFTHFYHIVFLTSTAFPSHIASSSSSFFILTSQLFLLEWFKHVLNSIDQQELNLFCFVWVRPIVSKYILGRFITAMYHSAQQTYRTVIKPLVCCYSVLLESHELLSLGSERNINIATVWLVSMTHALLLEHCWVITSRWLPSVCFMAGTEEFMSMINDSPAFYRDMWALSWARKKIKIGAIFLHEL